MQLNGTLSVYILRVIVLIQPFLTMKNINKPGFGKDGVKNN